MQQLLQALRALPTDIDSHGREPSAIAPLSDAELVQAVGLAISRPKAHGWTSFTLHAPLELLARAALLPLAPPEARSAGRIRIASIAAHYAAGDEIAPPERRFSTADQAKSALITALREQDPDTADAALVALAPQTSAREYCYLLTDEIAPDLRAAAHAPLLLAALPQAVPRYGELTILLRSSIRLLATGPRVRLSWIDEPKTMGGPQGLWEALAEPLHVASASSFIAPTMLAVEADGPAARRLGRATEAEPGAAAGALLRIAALSMIQDDPDQAPYGWSHCLTLPQGVMALAPYARRADRLLRIAGTFVLGFRATLGRVRLDETWTPAATPEVSTLAARAAVHEDAHLAKYTIACLTAAAADPSARPLFLAAARHLGEWWDARARPSA